MKATITKEGFLKIQPESELEAFALSKWWESFPKRGEESTQKSTAIVIDYKLAETA